MSVRAASTTCHEPSRCTPAPVRSGAEPCGRGPRGSRSGAGAPAPDVAEGTGEKSARSRRGIWPVSGRTGGWRRRVTRTAMPSGGTSDVADGTSMVGSGIMNRNAITRSPASACTSAPGGPGSLSWKGAKPIQMVRAVAKRGSSGESGTAPSRRFATSVRGTARRSAARRPGSTRGGSGRGPRRRGRRGFARRSPASRSPACRDGCGRRGSSKSGSGAARHERGLAASWASRPPAPTREGVRGRRCRDTTRTAPGSGRGRARCSRRSPASRAVIRYGGLRLGELGEDCLAPNPASSNRLRIPWRRNASTTSTMGQRTSSPSGANGIIAVPPIPVAMVSKRSFGEGAVRRRDESEGLLREVPRRGLEEPRGDALAVAALAVAGSAVATYALYPGSRSGSSGAGRSPGSDGGPTSATTAMATVERIARIVDAMIRSPQESRDASQADSGRVSLRHAVPDRQRGGARSTSTRRRSARRRSSGWKDPTERSVMPRSRSAIRA